MSGERGINSGTEGGVPNYGRRWGVYWLGSVGRGDRWTRCVSSGGVEQQFGSVEHQWCTEAARMEPDGNVGGFRQAAAAQGCACVISVGWVESG